MFEVSVNLNVLNFLPNFCVFHIPLIFALQQLKIAKIYPIFSPIRLQIFFILTIIVNILRSISKMLREYMGNQNDAR